MINNEPDIETSTFSLMVTTRSHGIRARTSTKISPLRPRKLPTPKGLPFVLEDTQYGLIQERIHNNLYALLVQAILWNQTRGLAARPVLFQLLSTWPAPDALSQASLPALTAMLQPIGLHNTRAARLIALAKAWVTSPPCKERRYRKLHYPAKGCGADIKPGEALSLDDEREGWEVAHLPGLGQYALDSFRIFYRDKLRDVDEEAEPEWKRVLPLDKDLRAYLVWKWEQEGWKWNMVTGRRIKL